MESSKLPSNGDIKERTKDTIYAEKGEIIYTIMDVIIKRELEGNLSWCFSLFSIAISLAFVCCIAASPPTDTIAILSIKKVGGGRVINKRLPVRFLAVPF